MIMPRDDWAAAIHPRPLLPRPVPRRILRAPLAAIAILFPMALFFHFLGVF